MIDQTNLKDTEVHQDVLEDQSKASGYSFNTNASHASIMTLKTVYNEIVDINDETDFILLDIREPEDFYKFHIKESVSFPSPNINRDKYTQLIHEFRNKDNCLIIVYHDSEKHGIPSINIMAERGFDNVYQLSGGIEEFAQAYPELLEGSSPPIIDKKNFTKRSTAKIEAYRQPPMQPQVKKKENMLPSINNKIPSHAFNKNKPGSTMENRRKQDKLWNDIPDNDTYSQASSHVNSIKGKTLSRGGSRQEISIKPCNLVYNKNLGEMVFRERKLEKIDKKLTEKITNNRGNIDYQNYG